MLWSEVCARLWPEVVRKGGEEERCGEEEEEDVPESRETVAGGGGVEVERICGRVLWCGGKGSVVVKTSNVACTDEGTGGGLPSPEGGGEGKWGKESFWALRGPFLLSRS